MDRATIAAAPAAAKPAPRRKRSFVARAQNAAKTPPSAPGANNSDLPLLTEVIDPQTVAPYGLDAVLDDLGADLERRLAAWLDKQLPQLAAETGRRVAATIEKQAREALLPEMRSMVDAYRKKN